MPTIADAEILGPIPYGGVIVFRGVPDAEHDKLRADIQAAAEHSKFVIVFIDSGGAVTLDGDANMHKAMVATLTDEMHQELLDRAEAHFVNRVQPMLAQAQRDSPPQD